MASHLFCVTGVFLTKGKETNGLLQTRRLCQGETLSAVCGRTLGDLHSDEAKLCSLRTCSREQVSGCIPSPKCLEGKALGDSAHLSVAAVCIGSAAPNQTLLKGQDVAVGRS